MALVLIDGNTQTGGATVQSSTRKMLLNDPSVATALYVRFSPVVPAYSQSTDDLATWPAATNGSAVAGTLQFDAYYRRWDDRSADNIVDLFYDGDAISDGLFHIQLNLDTMTFGSEHWITGGVIGHPSIEGMSGVRALSGRLYSSGGGTFFYPAQVWYSDDEGDNWTGPIAVAFVEDDSGDYCTLWPDYSSADPHDISGIFWDASASQISVKQLDASVPSIAETVIASSMTASATQTNISSAVAENGHIRVAAFDGANPGTLKTWDVYGATVTAKTNVLTSVADVSCVAIQILDEFDWTVIFYQRDGAIYYQISRDQMATWDGEVFYGDAEDNDYISIQADPRPAVSSIAAMFYEDSSRDLWTVAPAVPLDDAVLQYRLMLAEVAEPDIPTLNITPHNADENRVTLVKFERGKSRAVLGEPPAAGQMSAIIENPALGRYGLDEPTPGLAMRLNKKYTPLEDWYHMCQVNLIQPRHTMANRRFLTTVEAVGYGPLTKLANKRVSTALYKDIPVGTAVGHLLDAAGFPSFMRDIDTGEVILRYFWVNDEDAMTVLNRLTNSEGITAEYLERGDGTLCWRGRNARYTDTESANIQFTFTSEGAEPRLTDFEYFPGGNEVVNYASHERIVRADDTGTTTVWEDAGGAAGVGNYILLPNEEFVLLAVGEQPFFDAIVPVLNTDYEVGLGTVTVALERTSGQRTKITFTAGAGGATIGGVGADNIKLRATTTIVGFAGFDGIFYESSKVDASVSIARHGVKPWTGEMSKEMNWYDMRDNLDAIVTYKQNPVGRVKFGLFAPGSATRNEAMAKLDLGYRVRLIEPDFDFDGELWIEHMSHEVRAPAGPVTGPEVGYERMDYECSVISVAVGSDGTGLGEDNPFDSIDNGSSELPTTGLNDQGVAARGMFAGVFFGAGP